MSNEPARRVFVLGAGASRDAGYPLVADMLSRERVGALYDALPELNPFVHLGNGEARRSLMAACDKFRSIDPNIETLFAQFTAQGLRTESEALKRYMAKLFFLAREHAATQEGCGYAMTFAARLAPYPSHASIITFNYDLLYDWGLSAVGMMLRTPMLSYGLGGRATQSHEADQLFMTATNCIVPPYSGSIPLLKLHGSLNWMSCEACGQITIYPSECIEWDDIRIDGYELACAGCRSARLSPLLLPPSEDKEMKPLAFVWQHAEQLLDAADLVVFIGYSLPEYDVHALDLFRRTCSGFHARRKQLILVDPGPAAQALAQLKRINRDVVHVRSTAREFITQSGGT
ncbi:MAG: hypothetical protein IT459_02375 [Planctomycetes bacterium]|nr:hypothetical protein [Planctomycetota bacterium]